MLSFPERLSKRKVFTQSMIGRMFCFYYDPKHKKTLPYYDTFPLVFPVDMMEDGRLACLNLHYINPTMRAFLMGKLYSLLEDEPNGDKRLGLSYSVLKSASQYKFFKPCFKTYLIDHVRSRFLSIEPKYWDLTLSLPTAQFVKESEMKVWEDSLKIIRKADEK
jgi:hypothetical protein